MENQKSCSQRFVLLVVWCGLLSVALLIMTVAQLTSRHNTQDQENNMQQNEPKSQLAPSCSTAGRPLSHIHLTIMDSNLTLKDDMARHFANTSRSLVLRNNSVHVTSGGFYHFYAHVTFGRVSQPAKRTVTLIRNAVPGGRADRSLSEAVGWGDRESSISISQIIRCQGGQSLRLEIQPRITLRYNTYSTYWGLFLLTPN